MPLQIRPVNSIEDAQAVDRVIQAAWGGGPEASIADHMTFTVAKQSGVVLLAVDDDRPVGFCMSFLAFDDPNARTLRHWSHMAGVIPEYRGIGLGERLKWAQRDGVIAQEIGRMSWTFDPLETLNGRLNLHKLGTVCNTYQRNLYGDALDPLNQGIETDRFEVDWWLHSDWVTEAKQGELQRHGLAHWQAVAPVVNLFDEVGGVVEPAGSTNALEDHDLPYKLLAVPSGFQAIKQVDMALAINWRFHTRRLFETSFSNGYTAIDLVRGGKVCHYVLQKDWTP